jgi:uncharacterized repeat protein (TIGR03806 family)
VGHLALRRWLLLLVWCACSDGGEGQPDAGPTIPYAKLSDYGFFQGNGASQTPRAGVVPFAVNAPLFADFAAKHRFIVLPPGGKITYADTEKWVFPVGTIIVKTFSFVHDMRDPSLGERLIETRLLVHATEGWTPYVYVWNDEQTEATLFNVGARVPVSWVDEQGNPQANEYRVPNTNQCLDCHGVRGTTNLLGLRTRQMNHLFDYGAGPENQIDHMVSLAMFDGDVPPSAERQTFPDPYDPQAGTVEMRARAWLEANCSHCHRPGGGAGSTGLYLFSDVTVPHDYGVCKIPNAAGAGSGGRPFDIVPGTPDESVMTFRIASVIPGIKMPEEPILLVDQKGVDLITAWIASMSPVVCTQ